jgi:hypothetical protein
MSAMAEQFRVGCWTIDLIQHPASGNQHQACGQQSAKRSILAAALKRSPQKTINNLLR